MSPLILYYLALFVGLYMAWNIGANDVANSMGTSVGSKAITLRQAVIIAAIFEFSGAFLVGGQVTHTVRKGILDLQVFVHGSPHLQYLFVVGMFAALAASAIWLNFASYFGWPVSTTHSIVGGIVGAGLVTAGMHAVNWSQVGWIAASWVVSPVVGALIAAGIYFVIKYFLLDVKDQEQAVHRWTPFLLWPIFFVLFLTFVFKGLKHLPLAQVISPVIKWMSAALLALVLAGVLTKPIRNFIQKGRAKPDFHPAEDLFRYLQVVTASFVAFAHGSNDVANAIGPMAAIRDYYIQGHISEQGVPVPSWMLALGGIGIILGLATYGYKVIATIGQKVTELVPTRGFSAEFGTALTILTGSYLGLPLSTTHTLVGSVIGVGLVRGLDAVDLSTLKSIGISWIITLPFAGAIAAGITWGFSIFL